MTLTSLAAENATPEYAYLSTINVMPLLMHAFILGLKQNSFFSVKIFRITNKFHAAPSFLER
jgi:hypothetical protein